MSMILYFRVKRITAGRRAGGGGGGGGWGGGGGYVGIFSKD